MTHRASIFLEIWLWAWHDTDQNNIWEYFIYKVVFLVKKAFCMGRHITELISQGFLALRPVGVTTRRPTSGFLPAPNVN